MLTAFFIHSILYEDHLKESNVNKLKYKIEELDGVKSCEISSLCKKVCKIVSPSMVKLLS